MLAVARSVRGSWGTWQATEDIGQAIASDGTNDFFAIVVTFTTGSAVHTVVVATAETCASGCTY